MCKYAKRFSEELVYDYDHGYEGKYLAFQPWYNNCDLLDGGLFQLSELGIGLALCEPCLRQACCKCGISMKGCKTCLLTFDLKCGGFVSI